jgi:hypothetical protein
MAQPQPQIIVLPILGQGGQQMEGGGAGQAQLQQQVNQR